MVGYCDHRPEGKGGIRAGLRLAVAWLIAVTPLPGRSEEIAPFRLTHVEGYANLRFLRDAYVTSQPGLGAGVRARQQQTDLREEVFFMTRSYVYHPGFLALDLGTGLVTQQGGFATDNGETRARATLTNFTGRASFLREKPYRGSVFYEHLNPTLSVAPGQIMLQENSRYGVELSMLAPASPVPLHFDAVRSRNQGSSSDRILDDRIDQINFRASPSWGRFGSTQLQMQAMQQASQSGSPNLAIQATSMKSNAFSLDTRLKFGAQRQYDLTNLVTFNAQSFTLDRNQVPDRRDLRVLLDLRTQHSATLRSFGSWNYSTVEQADLGSKVRSAAAGLTWSPFAAMSASLGARGEDAWSPQLKSRSQGVDASVQAQHALALGSLQASYAVRYDRRAQQAVIAQGNVIGERVSIVGGTFVTLSRQRVNVPSIVVTNKTRTQTFVEGRDYRLTILGLDTRLQRLVGGNILDGEEVLVDYGYDVGGTFAYVQSDQSLNLNWSLRSLLNVYFRRFDSAPQLVSGTPSFPLNPVQSSLYGLRVDLPVGLPLQVVVGGSLERENRQEAIAPYRRAAVDLYAQMEDPWSGAGNLRLSARQTRTQYESSAQNVDLRGYDFNYWSRHWQRVDLSAQASYEEDTGGLTARQRVIGSAKAHWRYRKLSLTFEMSGTREAQGGMQRSRALVQIQARRDF